MENIRAVQSRPAISRIVRGPFDRPRVAISYDPERGLTHQSFKDECDITRIVETYARTGIIPTHRMQPHYGDAPESDVFEAACAQAAIRTAEEEGWTPQEGAQEASDGEISDSEGDTLGVPQKEALGASGAPSEGDQSAQ
ncbi:MAG: portal protein [Microviridae sp.]|nr:MAG: portal protein [Microviridae sp.]